MSAYTKCPNCQAKQHEYSDLQWFYDCDICGKETAGNAFDFDKGEWEISMWKRKPDVLVKKKCVCEECREALKSGIEALVEKLSKREEVTA